MKYILANPFEALAVVHMAALFVVNFTPTPKDNTAVSKAYKVLEIAAGLLTRKAKQ